MAADEKQSDAKDNSRAPVRASARVSSARTGGGRLEGKTAVVTGASRGIGLGIAKAFAAQGCRLVITGRDIAALENAAAEIDASYPGGSKRRRSRVSPVACDVRDEDSVKRMFSAAAEQFGALDILVNNAGVSQPMKSIEETSLELWRENIDTNLTGPFLCTRSALPLMREGSIIVNILSVAARKTFPKFSAYNSAKHGALGFTLTVREEVKDRGIRVSAVMPGATSTAIWEQFWPDAPREKMIDVETIAEQVLSLVLMSPKANPSELIIDPLAGPL